MITIEETAATWRVTAEMLSVIAARKPSLPPSPSKSSRAVQLRVRAAGGEHQVVTLQGGPGGYRRTPCTECPWRKDSTGVFPAEAFVHSAGTAYDLALEMFGCHQSGRTKPATCAGFLLRGADHNLTVRMGHMTGKFKRDVLDGGHVLHASYRDMAVANGVDPDHPALKLCR